MKKLIYIFIAFLSASCLRLDDNLFNADNSIESYQLDNYTGEVDFTLDDSYKIPESLIHVFQLTSDYNGDQKNIYAIYIGDMANIATDTVIMYCHGNKDHMDFYWQRAKLLAHVGGKNRYGVLMIDYRGYGLSEGESSEQSIYADVHAALKWLEKQGLTNERFMMYGFSLGSAPTCQLTANPTCLVPSKVILEAPFASAEVMVQDASGLSLPASYFTNYTIDNAEEIKKISQPLMWLHGTNDNFLNIKTHGEVVYKNHGGTSKNAQRISGADHGDVPLVMGFTAYTDSIASFIVK